MQHGNMLIHKNGNDVLEYDIHGNRGSYISIVDSNWVLNLYETEIHLDI